MKVTIQSPKITLNEKQQEYIIKKFNHLDKLYHRIEECQVIFKREKNEKQNSYLIEAKLAVPGNDLFAREEAENLELAVDKTCSDLESQLRRKKEKFNTRDRQAKHLISQGELDF